jgi:magnesium chelatase subunit D
MSDTYRQRVVRADGRTITVVQRRAHLSYCCTGCCCGRTERGYAAAPVETYKNEWLGRKLRKAVHLTKAACLGPCALANVASLVFDGHSIWFHSVNTPWHVRLIYDYVETMLRVDRFVPPPPDLTEYVFNFCDWDVRPAAPEGRPKGNAAPRTLVLLSHADTDLLTLRRARAALPPDLTVAGRSLLSLRSVDQMQMILDGDLADARIVVLRDLLGGLDVERAMKGQPSLKPGLVSQAHGGVLYIDEVNLLPDHLADALLDAVASGIHLLEREGFSAAQEARFVLVGSMNPEEGVLRPQLLDRFALSVDVEAPGGPMARRLVVERRLRFDADPSAFSSEWNGEQDACANRIAAAKRDIFNVECPAEVLDYVANAMCERGVRSLRADLAAVRASRALAALIGASAITLAHVDEVLPLVVAHRTAVPPRPPRPNRPSPSPPGAQQDDAGAGADAGHERVFAAVDIRGPQLAAPPRAAAGQAAGGEVVRRGAAMHSRPSERPLEIDARATVVHALARSGSPRPQTEDLHEIVRAPVGSRRFVFVVDASGSQAAQQRMRFVKGAVVAMLERSARRHDEVVLIAFRGSSASVVLPPTHSVDEATTALAYLPTGGRTPLAHGLELAAHYVTDGTTLILLTDGRANVPSRSDDAWADALGAAAAFTCPALVVDSESEPRETGRARQLAEALGAAHVRLADVDETSMLQLVPARESGG